MDHELVATTMRIFRANSDFCVFDLETTDKHFGPNHPDGKTLQIAARRYRYDHVNRTSTLLAQVSLLLNDPTITEISTYLTEEVHHIGMGHIRDAAVAATYGCELVDPTTAWKRFANLLDGAVAMGHNIVNFDIAFAQWDAARWGVALPFRTIDGTPLPVSYNAKTVEILCIDTVRVARLLWHRDNRGQGKAGYKLRSLANMLHVKTDPTLDHNALGDINTNWLLFLAMLNPLRSYQSRFLSPNLAPDQYRRMLPPLRASIPTPEEHAAAIAARDAAADAAMARHAEGEEEDAETEDSVEVAS